MFHFILALVFYSEVFSCFYAGLKSQQTFGVTAEGWVQNRAIQSLFVGTIAYFIMRLYGVLARKF